MFLFFTSRKYSVTDDILLFCIIFVHPALADKWLKAPNFSILLSPCRKGLIFPTGLFKERWSIFPFFRYIGAVPLLFFMQRRMKKLRERDRERYLQLLEGILDNLPIAAKVKDVNDGMRYTFGIKGRGTL